MMNNLYEVTDKIKNKKNYVYTTGNRAKAFASWHNHIDGFVARMGKEDNLKALLNKPVITLEEAANTNVNVLIVHTAWHALYDEVRSKIKKEHIFFYNDSYTESNEQCLVCGGGKSF